MNKLDMETVNITNENIARIGQLFPNVIVESENGKSIDFDLLKQELSNEIVEGAKEKYQLTWPGKKEAIVLANTPSKNTLRPIREKSVNFDNTQNIYIEGDNLEALKILQESYLNKIKCIYIDPPYNTGNDFIYKDKFKKDNKDELLESGQIDEDGNKLVTNNQSNGRFHSDWLSMMYSRLKLARNLLAKDGLIFISIDDNELENLKKICDEIFGESSFISNIVVESGGAYGAKTAHKDKTLFKIKDYVLVYQYMPSDSSTRCPLYDKAEEPFDPRYSFYISDDLTKQNLIDFMKNDMFISSEFKKYNLDIKKENISKLMKISDKFNNMMLNDIASNIYKDSQFTLTVPSLIADEMNIGDIKKYDKYLLIKTQNGNIRHLQSFRESLTLNDEYIPEYTRSVLRGDLWKNFVKDMGNIGKEGNVDFKNGKKPVRLIKQLLKWANDKSMIVLDFFSGSATTAQAVMQLNAEDNGNRKFILIQIPEKCDENSEAYKNGYKDICDLGEERMRRSAAKIKEETNANIDYGFRVYKIDSSNMKDVYYKPNDLKQSQLTLFESNVKGDRTTDDLLTQVILDLGLTLDLKIEEKQILNNKVYYVDNNSLIACFDDNVDINIVDEICKCQPLKVVFKDSSFKYDNDKINLEERFKKLSPETEINIL